MDDPKPPLRARLRALRRAHVVSLGPSGRLEAERALADTLAPLLTGATCIASYAAQGAELDPRWIAASLAFPRVAGELLTFHLCRPDALRPGHRGIPEPASTAPLASPDIVLVPLVAAAPDGTRLGQGGGFYDRALSAMRRDRPIIAIGLAWDMQILPALPRDPWDERLDWIATPSRLVDCAITR